MGAIGRDEVDQRLRMLEVHHHVGPTDVGLQVAVAGGLKELRTSMVEARYTGVATAGDVQRRQIQRQAHQVVAQRLGDELVDLVAHRAGQATHDGAGGVFRGHPAGGVGQGVEEGGDQAQLLVVGRVQRIHRHRVEVCVEAIHRLGQHRVAEAVNRVGELGDDRGIEIDVIDLGRREEQVDVRLDGPRELLEHQVLVLHLGTELGGLEQPLAVPLQSIDFRRGGREGSDRSQQPLVDERQVIAGQHRALGLLHQAVVLGVEDRMHGGQADVLVDPAVAGDVVGVQQFAVVGTGRLRDSGLAVDQAIAIPHQPRCGRRVGGMGDVAEELMPGADRAGQADTQAAVGGRVAFDQHIIIGTRQPVQPGEHYLREAVGPLDEIAVGVGGQQWHVEHVGIGQVDPEDVACLGLDHRPGGHATDFHVVVSAELAIDTQVAVGDQLTGCHGTIGRGDVRAQEHLVRRVRAVGLVLIDEGRGGVLVHPRLAVDLSGAGQHHEVGRAAGDETRVVRLQRDVHGAVAALGHQVQAMVEELPEEGHPGVEGRGQPGVGGGVRDKVHLLVIGRAEQAIQTRAGHQGGAVGARRRGYGRRVVVGLVDDEVGDGTWVAVDHIGGGVVVGVGLPEEGRLVLLVAELWRQQPREGVVGGAELALVDAGEVQQVVELAGDRAQAGRDAQVGYQGQQVGAGGMSFGDADLVEDEVQVATHQLHAGTASGDRRARLHCRGRRRRGEGRHGDGGYREHLFGHPVGILVDAFHPNRQARHVRGDAVTDAVGADEGQVASRHFDDVLEDARGGHTLHLPDVVDIGDGATGIVGVVDVQGRDGEEVAHLQLAAVIVGDAQRAAGFGVQAGGQDHRLVGELQPFDMGQAVSAVVADIVNDRDYVIGEVARGAVVVDGDAVVGAVAREDGGVEVRVTGQQFAHGHQLAGVDGAVQHGRHQGQIGRGTGKDARLVLDHADHAVGAADLVASSITNADAHVQPQVAIDQVIATAPFEEVAAAAAEDDVAAVEHVVRGTGVAVGARRGGTDKRSQTCDQIEVGQRAAGGPAMVNYIARVYVVAA
ncbi:hypothetical protein D3C80_379860 [compost metagenome]